ncbi:MAG: hypothetical protein PHG85_06585 [Candidatus Altiarchaeota archaeon]|nr:hypothetical protein [Candidatus Altiarchaeota archaeon]
MVPLNALLGGIEASRLKQAAASVPEYIRERNLQADKEARSLYESPVKLKGKRPATAHRNHGVEERLHGILERMDRIVTTDFRDLRRGVDYDRTGSIGVQALDRKGFFRNVTFDLETPETIDNQIIYAVRLKGVTFNRNELHREFDLLEAQRMGGMQVPAGAVRLDRYIDKEGIVVATPHVNEPLGAEFLDETTGEARGAKLCQRKDERVDYPLCWYEYDSQTRPPNGLLLGAMAVGLTSRKRISIGTTIGELAERPKKPSPRTGRDDAWRGDVESVFQTYVDRISRLHGGGKGLYHESPHPGQFHFADGRRNEIIMSDLRNIEPLEEMTYPQKIGCMALDLKSVIIYALRYDSFPVFGREGMSFLDMTLKYFNKADGDTLGELRRMAPSSGGRIFEGVFNLSWENKKPVTFYKSNPLIKALMQEYPDT